MRLIGATKGTVRDLRRQETRDRQQLQPPFLPLALRNPLRDSLRSFSPAFDARLSPCDSSALLHANRLFLPFFPADGLPLIRPSVSLFVAGKRVVSLFFPQ